MTLQLMSTVLQFNSLIKLAKDKSFASTSHATVNNDVTV